MKTARNHFAGMWRIVWMEQWDLDYVDEEVTASVKRWAI